VKFVAVSTVVDQGAANVAKEALEAAGIPVELRRAPGNPYFARMTSDTFEVRVPHDRVLEAERVLARLSADVEEALLAEASRSMPEESKNGVSRPPRNTFSLPALAMMLLFALAAVAYIYMETHRVVQP